MNTTEGIIVSNNGIGIKGTTSPTNAENEVLLPAGIYHIVQYGESTLVGTRSGIITGLIPSMLGIELTENLPDFLEDFYVNFDSHITPAAGIPASICWGHHPITFIGDINMGRNHCGWTDGFFFIPDAVFNEIVSFDARFDPERSIITLPNDSVLSSSPFDESLDLDCSYFGITINGNRIGYSDVEFVGTQETL